MDVVIIMGSKSDLDIVKPAYDLLKEFQVDVSIKILSAHRTPDALLNYLNECENAHVQVYIAAAGGAAHLGGVIAAHTIKPVIGIPIKTDLSGGLDSLLSIVQMPSGVPVASMAVNGAKNAGLFAAQIIALNDPELQRKLSVNRAEQRAKVFASNEALEDLK